MSESSNTHRMVVAFEFAAGWSVDGPDGKGSGFPPGTNLLPLGRDQPTILIQPLDLQNSDVVTAYKVLRKRADDLANISQALAVTQLEFREALDALGQTLPTTAADGS